MDDNDISNDFEQLRQDRQQRDALDWLQQNAAQRTTPAQVDIAPILPDQQDQQQPTQATPQPAQQEHGWLYRTAADIGSGLMSAGSQVPAGIYDAAVNFIKTGNSLADWANENIADLRIPVDLGKWGNNPLAALLDTLPASPAMPDSNTGMAIRKGAQFLTGFIPAVRAARVLGAGGVLGSGLAGGVSSFFVEDPNDANFANFLSEFPALKPYVEPLATNPNDPDLLNRLRKAVESTGMGMLTEGVVRGLQTYFANKAAKAAARGATRTQQRYDLFTQGPLTDEQLARIQPRPDAPVVMVADKIKAAEKRIGAVNLTAEQVKAWGDDALKQGYVAWEGKKGAFINTLSVNEPLDVTKVINEMVKMTDEPARQTGPRTWKMVDNVVDEMGWGVDDVLRRKIGEAWSDRQLQAGKELMVSVLKSVDDLAQKAVASGDPVDKFLFRRQAAVFDAVQMEMMGARAEAGRALNVLKKFTREGASEAGLALRELMEQFGESTDDLARAIVSLKQQGRPLGALGAALRKSAEVTTRDMVAESYTLGMLWRPTTWLRNSASNTASLFQAIYERGLAAKVGHILGSRIDDVGSAVVDGEAMWGTYGMIMSIRDAMRNAGRAFATGQRTALAGKVDIRPGAITGMNFAKAVRGMDTAEAIRFSQTPMGHLIDWFGAATRGSANILAGTDEFYKTLLYSFELHAQALRRATQKGLTGAAKWTEMARLVNNPDEAVRMAANQFSLYHTFNNKAGPIAAGLMQLRGSGTMQPLFLLFPYIRTPANIMSYSFSRTPLAPFVGQWRADILAGGARRDLALARMAAGTAVIAVAMDWAMNGMLTGAGPKEKAAKDAWLGSGRKPYAVRVGDKYFQLSGADPITMPLAIAASIAELVSRKELHPRDYDTIGEMVYGTIASVAWASMNRTYFTGFTQLWDAVENADKNPRNLDKWMQRQAQSLMPFSSVFKATEMAKDPTYREFHTMGEAMKAQIAFLSETLPDSLDRLGDPIAPQGVYGAPYDVVSPFAVSQLTNSPFYNELVRMNKGISRIGYSSVIDGAPMDLRDFPWVYHRYAKLAGQELIHPGHKKGFKDFINSVISGEGQIGRIYQRMNDYEKYKFIHQQSAEYTALAQQQLLAEIERGAIPKKYADKADQFAAFYQAYQHIKGEQTQKRLPENVANRVMGRERPPRPFVMRPIEPQAQSATDSFTVPGGNQ